MSANLNTTHTLRSGGTVPPRFTCDQLGICHHPNLDCNEGTCHRALLADGHVDVPLPAALPAMGGGNFWLDPTEDPHGVTPGAQQPHLMDVTPRPPSTGEIVWFWRRDPGATPAVSPARQRGQERPLPGKSTK